METVTHFLPGGTEIKWSAKPPSYIIGKALGCALMSPASCRNQLMSYNEGGKDAGETELSRRRALDVQEGHSRDRVSKSGAT